MLSNASIASAVALQVFVGIDMLHMLFVLHPCKVVVIGVAAAMLPQSRNDVATQQSARVPRCIAKLLCVCVLSVFGPDAARSFARKFEKRRSGCGATERKKIVERDRQALRLFT